MEETLSQTAVVACPRNMVGRVIGKGGETIKALQQYTGAVIQIDQSQDPTRVTIAGEVKSLQLAVCMIKVTRVSEGCGCFEEELLVLSRKGVGAKPLHIAVVSHACGSPVRLVLACPMSTAANCSRRQIPEHPFALIVQDIVASKFKGFAM